MLDTGTLIEADILSKREWGGDHGFLEEDMILMDFDGDDDDVDG